MEMGLFPVSPILIVDDEENYLNSVRFQLRSNGITNVERCQDSREVIPRLKKNRYSLILLDLEMPHKSGKDILAEIVEDFPGVPVIIVTAFMDIKIAVDCMKNGVFDCLIKPAKIKDLIRTVKDVLNLEGSHEKIILLKKNLFSNTDQNPKDFFSIVTKSEKMQLVFQSIGIFAATSRPLLIGGENGVGKKFVAHEIHKQSKRKGKFVSFNTTGLDDDLFTEKLFGRRIGVISSEKSYKEGLLEEASGGTIYLDDVGELSLKSQEKLLNLLQEREYCPQGIDKPLANDARVIAITSKNLTALTQIKSFRQDLTYLLKTNEIFIPPLRERKEDIPLLLDYFVKEAAEMKRTKRPSIPEELNNILEQYDFPGNIDELKDMVYEAVRRNKTGGLFLDIFIERIKDEVKK
ncbi:MAG: sigma-54-dependent Fis family transcriptional regulator [Candidatus Aminicenantes bacterium]|nr:sigma-54-dependent Fis family transcriptional regulator [Candidatus Aminicenantes bacterium]